MNRSAEVIVVGGGVIGSAVAFELARRSVDVLLVDKTLPGRATSASAGPYVCWRGFEFFFLSTWAAVPKNF